MQRKIWLHTAGPNVSHFLIGQYARDADAAERIHYVSHEDGRDSGKIIEVVDEWFRREWPEGRLSSFVLLRSGIGAELTSTRVDHENYATM